MMRDESRRMLGLLEAAVPAMRQLIAGVGDGQWAAPSPCEEMDVLALVGHVVGGLEQFADVPTGAGTGTPVEVEPDPSSALDAFDSASGRLLAAWAGDGVADRAYAMPWGETPGATLLGFMVLEEVTHGWDLARATAQRPAFDDDVVAAALQLARSYDDATIRVPGMFGPEVPVADDAPVLDRLAGFLGRDPAAWPSTTGARSDAPS